MYPNYLTYRSAPQGPQPLWTELDVGTYLGVPAERLSRWRRAGTGPPWVKVGKSIRYVPAQVIAWVETGGAAS